MKELTSTEFRLSYAQEAEPIRVTAYGKPIGTWYPIGMEPAVPAEQPQPPAEDSTPARMTIRPVKGQPKAMVGQERRILDPMQAIPVDDPRRRERDTWSQLQKRLYGNKSKS